MAVLVDDLLELLDSTFVLFDDRQEGVLKVLKQRDDGLRTCFVGVQNLRSLDPRQTVLGFSSHERKHPTVFAFPESPTFVRYSGSNELNSYEINRIHLYTYGDSGKGIAYWSPMMLELNDIYYEDEYENLQQAEKDKILARIEVEKGNIT